ncbi:hypothetical protein [Hydrogenophaga sp.]|uniref:hypothetical protein n=1 Tax=Hydrogenophaga sp. TaxID=1904254 RepID=UPI00272F8E70|nr:hypothetical protein [Hydrogenophaga sp.]MDP2018510.1 hypothetical protein [Hydrogenophaga sp.]MDP3164997.1 hypothetical protein [Hydrogenophaga sp.]
MSTPQDELVEGVDWLRPLMEANGFEFSLGETGTGSGGTFATGQYRRGDRVLTFSVRYGLGMVEYKVGQSGITHEDFLRYSGAWGRHAYPNFGGTVQASFSALKQDLANHVQVFLSGTDAEFLAVVRARDAEPNKYKGFASLGGRR